MDWTEVLSLAGLGGVSRDGSFIINFGFDVGTPVGFPSVVLCPFVLPPRPTHSPTPSSYPSSCPPHPTPFYPLISFHRYKPGFKIKDNEADSLLREIAALGNATLPLCPIFSRMSALRDTLTGPWRTIVKLTPSTRARGVRHCPLGPPVPGNLVWSLEPALTLPAILLLECPVARCCCR